MSLSKINNYISQHHVMAARVAVLTVIIGIILSGALYSEWGAVSMSFLSISVVGLALLYATRSHSRKKTASRTATASEFSGRDPHSPASTFEHTPSRGNSRKKRVAVAESRRPPSSVASGRTATASEFPGKDPHSPASTFVDDTPSRGDSLEKRAGLREPRTLPSSVASGRTATASEFPGKDPHSPASTFVDDTPSRGDSLEKRAGLREPRTLPSSVASGTKKSLAKSFHIPQEVKARIEANIESIRSGINNEEIQFVPSSASCVFLVFQVKGFNYYFKTNKPGESSDLIMRQFQAIKDVQKILNRPQRRHIRESVIIPQAETFFIGSIVILGLESLSVIGKDTLEFEQAQREFFKRATGDQITDLVLFSISTRFRYMSSENLLGLAGSIPFGIVNFDQYSLDRSSFRPITEGLFGSNPSSLQGLFGIFSWDEESRNRVLQIIVKAVHLEGLLGNLIHDLQNWSNQNAPWLLAEIEKIVSEEQLLYSPISS